MASSPLKAITTSPNLIKSQYASAEKENVVPPLSSTKELEVNLYNLVASPANIDTTPLSDLNAPAPWHLNRYHWH